MLDRDVADRWIDVFRREEALLSRFIEILQSDQRAFARSSVEEIEENLRAKEALFAEFEVVKESRNRLPVIEGWPAEGENGRIADFIRHFPPPVRGEVKSCIERIRSLREALSELNEATRHLMVHGLYLVRSTLRVIHGAAESPRYGENGDLCPAASTGRIVRKNA